MGVATACSQPHQCNEQAHCVAQLLWLTESFVTGWLTLHWAAQLATLLTCSCIYWFTQGLIRKANPKHKRGDLWDTLQLLPRGKL